MPMAHSARMVSLRAVVVVTALALVGPVAALAPPAGAASSVAVLTDASAPETTVFPNDAFTVADGAQATGKRVSLPTPTCPVGASSPCDAVALLNTLDGFDLQPRVFIPFSGPIDVASVTPDTVYVVGTAGRVGLQQLTFDPATNVLAGTTRAQLPERSLHYLVVTRGVLDPSGQPIAADVVVPFTTMSGTTELERMRQALDSGAAYRSPAGTASKAVSFTQPNVGDAFTVAPVTTVFPPTATELISRQDQVLADPTKPKTSSTVPNLAVAGVGCYGFGSFESPQYARADSTITPTPSGSTPAAVGKARIGFTLIVPAGVPPAGGWPVAVYGPGFTRSYFDLFVTSDLNAAAGIATIATDPLGHGFGPASTITVGSGAPFLSYGRGKDLDGDGKIGEAEGSQPTKTVTLDGAGKVVTEEPSANQLHGLRGGLIQTTVDNMALVRAVENGVSVPNCPAGNAPALTGPAPLNKVGVQYYGLSFGGIYGTMLMGTDTDVQRGLLNVPGGPIVDIARLSGFRPLLSDTLRVSKPTLLNGGPGRDGFTESIPDPLDPPIIAPAAGAMTLQRYLAYATWYGRPGGPETYAPLLSKAPRAGELPKDVLYQIAFGDNTVPNITSGNIIRAGNLFDRVTYYRNDKTPTSGTNPHGFLASPALAGRVPGEVQLTTFLKTGQRVDPDLAGPIFELPIANPLNLQCLHYPNPQTGQGAFPPPAAGECVAAPAGTVPVGTGGGGGSGDQTDGGSAGQLNASRSLAVTGGAPLLGIAALVLLAAAGVGWRLRRR